MPPALRRALFWSSLPLVLPQGLWLRRTARRLPVAAGPAEGHAGVGRHRKLVAIGDSIVAGVGTDRLEHALPGLLAAALADRHQCRVHWQAHGYNGASCRDLLRALADLPAQAPIDWVFVSVGVNDVTRLTSGAAWQSRLRALMVSLAEHAPGAQILLAGVPPMQRFPGLPQPLRAVFGWRASHLDGLGQAVAARLPAVAHIPTPVPDDPQAFASDGYHPNANACAVWAQTLAERSILR